MAGKGENTVRHKLDRFWAALFLTQEGKPKSAFLLYSFCLSLVFLAVYAVSYFFLIDVLEGAFAQSSVLVRNIFESVVPGLAGSVVCCSLWFVIKNKRMVPAAYIWLALYALSALVAMAFLIGSGDFRFFLYFYLMLVPSGLVSGAVFSFLMFRKTLNAEAGAL